MSATHCRWISDRPCPNPVRPGGVFLCQAHYEAYCRREDAREEALERARTRARALGLPLYCPACGNALHHTPGQEASAAGPARPDQCECGPCELFFDAERGWNDIDGDPVDPRAILDHQHPRAAARLAADLART